MIQTALGVEERSRRDSLVGRLQRLLVGIDFGELSLAAAEWSATHFAPEAEHVLLHVLDVPRSSSLVQCSGFREELRQAALPAVIRRLEEVRASLAAERAASADERPVPQIAVREGSPAREIARLAEITSADLVVVGGHGQNRGAWSLLGSTADRVIRLGRIPVLVTRGPLRNPPGSLLVAVDGSSTSLRALSWAAFLGRRFGASVTVLHVASLVAQSHVGGVSTRASARQLQQHSSELEGKLRDLVRGAGVDPLSVSLDIAAGNPASEIVAAAMGSGADLVVVGSRGVGALEHAILGSVTDAVLRAVPCPVLVVGDPDRAGVPAE